MARECEATERLMIDIAKSIIRITLEQFDNIYWLERSPNKDNEGWYFFFDLIKKGGTFSIARCVSYEASIVFYDTYHTYGVSLYVIPSLVGCREDLLFKYEPLSDKAIEEIEQYFDILLYL